MWHTVSGVDESDMRHGKRGMPHDGAYQVATPVYHGISRHLSAKVLSHLAGRRRLFNDVHYGSHIPFGSCTRTRYFPPFVDTQAMLLN